jgi:hypothetical protein
MEPLRGSDARGDTAAIHHILARSEPIRIKHDRRHTCVEEFLVRWEPETCTFGEVLEKYRLGFNISSITSVEEKHPLPLSRALCLDQTPCPGREARLAMAAINYMMRHPI